MNRRKFLSIAVGGAVAAVACPSVLQAEKLPYVGLRQGSLLNVGGMTIHEGTASMAKDKFPSIEDLMRMRNILIKNRVKPVNGKFSVLASPDIAKDLDYPDWLESSPFIFHDFGNRNTMADIALITGSNNGA